MIGTKLNDRYELIEELGRGGMGVVYRAMDPVLNRDVAVKMIPPARLGQEAEERFRHEARIVAQMDHPALVPIHDFGHHEGSLYFVMPLVEGKPLRELIDDDNLTLGEIITIGMRVCEALEYSHARSVIHRDIKPGNIMVSRGAQLRIRVMDFGLAYTVHSEPPSEASPVGTLSWASPEQVSGLAVDARSDIYSLGVVLYECLAGSPPFIGTAHAVLYRILHDLPLPLRNRGVDLDPELEQIVLGCLEKDPARRPQKAGELAAALGRYRHRLAESKASHRLESRPPLVTVTNTEIREIPLVGRQAEMQALRDRLDAALDGECQLVLIGASTGVGKTRLLQELENLSQARKIRVLRGRFADRDAAMPFQGLCELIHDFFRVRDLDSTQSRLVPKTPTPEDNAKVPDFSDLADELVTVFPSLSEVPQLREVIQASDLSSATPYSLEKSLHPAPGGQDLSADAQGQQSYTFELLARALARIANGGPMVLLLENLQAAEVALEALQYIFRRLGPTPTLVVGTYQPDTISKNHPIQRLLRTANEDPRSAHLQLGPLQGEDFRRLVELILESRDLDAELISRLESATEGNPFFLQELIRALRESEILTRESDGGWSLDEAEFISGALPDSVQKVVEQRLERLPDDLHRVLRTAAILGRRFAFRDLDELVQAVDRKIRDLDDIVDQLLELGILEEDRKIRGDYLLFSSGVVREVYYRELPRRRRRSLHRKFARLLEERYEGRLERVYPQLVHHFGAAADAPETIEYGLELARRTLSSSPQEALRAARKALEFAEDEYDDQEVQPEVIGDLRMLLGKAHQAVGQSQKALEEAEKAAGIFDDANLDSQAASAALLAAEMAWQGRRVDAARWWLDRGLELAGQADNSETRSRLLTMAATLAHLRGEHEEAQGYLTEADKLASTTQEGQESAGDEVEPQPGGTLAVSMPCAISSLDPAETKIDEENEISRNVFETLISTNAHGSPVPHLAQKWEMQNRGRSFELTLRREACFANGRPLTALDVKSSLERAARLAHAPTLATEALVGIEAFREGKTDNIRGIVSPERTLADRDSPERVLFYLQEPLPIFPALLADSATAVVRNALPWDTTKGLLGTGPFCIDHHDPSRITLRRNERYWQGTPPLVENLDFITVRDGAAIVHQLKTGELDIGRDLPPQDLEDLLRDRRWRNRLAEATKRNTYFALFNQNGPLARHPEVRHAIAGMARVRDEVWRHLGRFAQPAVSLIPPGVLGYDPGRRILRMPAEVAQQLLGETLGPGPHPLEVVVHPALHNRYMNMTRALIQNWEELGFEVRMKAVRREEYIEYLLDGQDVDLILGRWVADYADPDNFTYMLFHSEFGRCRGFLSMPELDGLLSKARTELDPERRQTLYRRFEKQLLDEGLFLPLFHEVDYRLAGPRVQGLELTNTVPYVNYSRLARSSSNNEQQYPLADGGHLHIPIGQSLNSLDPVDGKLADQMSISTPVCETLTRLGDGAQVIPWLASLVEPVDDGAAYRIQLRQGVRFHDDRPLSIRDVRHSFERALRRQENAVQFPLLPIRGARAVRDGAARELAGLHVLAADEMILELEEPLPFFPALLANPATGIVPEGTEELSGSWDEGCVGTGPFRVVRWAPGDRLDLERNPHYWRNSFPRSERLSFHLGVSPENAVKDFRQGLLSLVNEIHAQDIEALRRDPKYLAGYREAPRLATYFLALNIRHGPLKDRERRHALVAALDVENSVRESLGRLVNRAQGLIPPGLLGARTSRVSRRQNAQQSGPKLDGLTLKAARLSPYRTQYSQLWETLISSLKNLGIEIEEVADDSNDVLSLLSKEGPDLVAFRWIADYPDADSFVTGLFHTSDGVLSPLCGTPELDRLADQGRRQQEAETREEIYREIESRLADEAIIVPLFHDQYHLFRQPALRGLEINLTVPEVRYESLYLER